METYKIIIAGSREFNDYPLLKNTMDKLIINKRQTHKIIIISGTCYGADKLGEKYGILSGFLIERYPANWEKYGKEAGFKRNTKMAMVANALVAFWNKQSNGTRHMINIATTYNLDVRVKYF